MQNNYNFKQNVTIQALSKRVIWLLFAFVFLLHSSFSAKSIDPHTKELPSENQQVLFFVSDNMIVHNQDAIFKTDDETQSKTNHQGEIFISEGVSVYVAESFDNLKITKIVTKKEKTLAKIVEEKKEPPLAKTKEIPLKKKAVTHFNSAESSTIFSQSEKKNLVFVQNRLDQLSKAFVSSSSFRIKYISGKNVENITYQDPSIVVCYFSGRHSVRPPTFLFV